MFQIGGKFGGAGGMIEMLVESRPGHIELLPALPCAWPTGSIFGVKARRGLELDIAWKDGKLDFVTIRGRKEALVSVLCNGLSQAIVLGKNGTATIRQRDGAL